MSSYFIPPVVLNDYDTARVVYLHTLFNKLPKKELPDFGHTLPLKIIEHSYIPLEDPAVIIRGYMALMADQLREVPQKPKRKKYLDQVLEEFRKENTHSGGNQIFLDMIDGLINTLEKNKRIILSLSYTLPFDMRRARNALINAGFVHYDCFSEQQTFQTLLVDTWSGEDL